MSEQQKGIVYFVGAGPGDPELITVKGMRLLEEADLVLYAGSLVNVELLKYVRAGVPCYDTAGLTLEKTMELIRKGAAAGKTVVRLHTGDPSLYGAIQEQIEAVNEEQIPWEIVPGVSSFLAAAALLGRELTVPGGTQTVVITRQGGRTPVPERESLQELGRHGSTICLFLSASLLDQAAVDLMVNLPADTPAAIVERVTWPGERFIMTTIGEMAADARAEGITKTAMVLIGDFLTAEGNRSLLYDPSFSHGYRTSQGDGSRGWSK
ncbi:MAG TPA: precorrin-4 C(11)-methyltransferase [Syntrophaceticus sp.]|jgi:precorrin-4/cobalt-precorrin-4 C11-methyltransferase|nr:precorrin-4 C(11)-methyltransferase [Syntrophaceticus sp.]